MTTQTSGCAGCGAPIQKPRMGRRKWCSEKCRKASYGDPCIDCGGRTIYGAEAARIPAPRCDACNRRHRSDRRCEHAIAILAGRREGLSNIELAARLDLPVNTVNQEAQRLRALGFSMPKCTLGRPMKGEKHAIADHRETRTLGIELAKRGVTP